MDINKGDKIKKMILGIIIFFILIICCCIIEDNENDSNKDPDMPFKIKIYNDSNSSIMGYLKIIYKNNSIYNNSFQIKEGDLFETKEISDEYGKYLFTALFIKGNETAETRARLKEFVETFETKYSDILVDWSGALIHFKEDHKLVEELFREV